MRSVPPVNNVRLSGKNATDHTGRPGPTSVCSSLRLAVDHRHRAADAGGGDQFAVGRDDDGNDRRGGGLNLAARFALGDRKYTLPSAPPATISPSGATATEFSGVGSLHDRRRAAAERPDAHLRIVADAHDRLAIGHEKATPLTFC